MMKPDTGSFSLGRETVFGYQRSVGGVWLLDWFFARAVRICISAGLGTDGEPLGDRRGYAESREVSGDSDRRMVALAEAAVIVDDVVSFDSPLVFPVSKDRPVLLSALASAQVLLTLDREDFVGLLGAQCYGLPILLPYDFLQRERTAGRLPNR